MNTEKISTEFIFRTSCSSGKGGQHVNRVQTKVELLFNVKDSNALTDEEKSKILKKLSNRISQDGRLQLTSQKSRSQLRNKNLIILKFHELIELALKPEKERKKTKIPKAIRKKRLKNKKLNGLKKAARKKVNLGRAKIDLFVPKGN